jgi:hypothetical protein
MEKYIRSSLGWIFLVVAVPTCGTRSAVHVTDGAVNDGTGPDVAVGPGDGAGDAPAAGDSSPREANQIPACALPGQQCYGIACCEGAGMCQAAPYMGSSTWTCGGIVAGGDDQACLPPSAPGCHWTELSGCGGYGAIDSFCPAGESARQLRRCSGSCFAPDRLYQKYQLCSCDSGPGPGRPACCSGPQWQAVLCCAAMP